MANKNLVFLESHNMKNLNFGFGQFNYHLIKAINDLDPKNFEITIHANVTEKFKEDFDNKARYV